LPDYSEDFLNELLEKNAKNGYLFQKNTLHIGLTHKEIMANVLKSLSIQIPRRTDIPRIVRALKHYVITDLEPQGMPHAQIAVGGVPLTEVNHTTFESLRVPKLYITGELLDMDGDCGGYNLMFAFLSGYTAGINAADGGNEE
jgi:predicted flavoprotein YhiN